MNPSPSPKHRASAICIKNSTCPKHIWDEVSNSTSHRHDGCETTSRKMRRVRSTTQYRWPIEIDGLPIKKGWIFPWQTVSHNQRVFRANVSPFEAPPFPPKNHGSTTTTTDLRLDGSSAHQAIDDLRAVLVPWGESFHQQK